MDDDYYYIAKDINKMKKQELVNLVTEIAEAYVENDKNEHSIGDVFVEDYLEMYGILKRK